MSLARHFRVIGFDRNRRRVEELLRGVDSTGEVEDVVALTQENLEFTRDPSRLRECNFIIVAVPTPVDKLKNPDFSFLRSASEIVGRHMKAGSVVVYESTV